MMAEAAVERPNTKYYCHKCTQEIDPVLPDYICPRCESGFIEELAQEHPTNSSEESEDDDMNDLQPASHARDVFHVIDFLQRVALEQGQGEDMETPGTSSGGPSFSSVSPMVPFPQRRRYMFRRPRRRTRQERVEMFRRPPEGFFNLQQLIATLLERRDNSGVPFHGFLNLHSSPADYAWGTGGLDAIITQLLNQFDGMGAPPLPREKIDEIPTTYITKDDVDKTLQCTVCMEDYVLGEPVKQLSCEHVFHNECIVPWLELILEIILCSTANDFLLYHNMYWKFKLTKQVKDEVGFNLHGTCPICRKLLNDECNQSQNTARSTVDDMTQSNSNPSNRNNPSSMETAPVHQTLCDFIDEDFD